MLDEIVRLNPQITTMRRGIGRLIDSYAEGLIDKTEFEPRIAGLKQRLSQLQERQRAALDAIEAARDLSLVISRLEDFSAKIANRLDGLDPLGMEEIIRILVRRIEIDGDGIEVVFRVPPPDGPGQPTPTDETASWQHRTGVGRTDARLDQPSQTPRRRLRGGHRVRARMAPHRPRVPAHPTLRQAGRSRNVIFESGPQ